MATDELGERINSGLSVLHSVGLEQLDRGKRNCFTCMDYRLKRSVGIAYCRVRPRVVDILAGFDHEIVLRRKCSRWNGDE